MINILLSITAWPCVHKIIGGLKICFKRTKILHVLQRNVANLPVVSVFVTLGYQELSQRTNGLQRRAMHARSSSSNPLPST